MAAGLGVSRKAIFLLRAVVRSMIDMILASKESILFFNFVAVVSSSGLVGSLSFISLSSSFVSLSLISVSLSSAFVSLSFTSAAAILASSTALLLVSTDSFDEGDD